MTEEVDRIRLAGGRDLRIETTLTVSSDAGGFKATLTRRLFENDRLVREKSFEEKASRPGH